MLLLLLLLLMMMTVILRSEESTKAVHNATQLEDMPQAQNTELRYHLSSFLFIIFRSFYFFRMFKKSCLLLGTDLIRDSTAFTFPIFIATALRASNKRTAHLFVMEREIQILSTPARPLFSIAKEFKKQTHKTNVFVHILLLSVSSLPY